MIRNIIFDLGGVLIDIDFDRAINAFKEMGFSGFDKSFNKDFQVELFNNIDKGKTSTNELRDFIRRAVKKNLSDYDIDNAWNKILIGFPKERMQLLEKISENYRIFLLSNTNEIHYESYNNTIKKEFGKNSVSDYFEKAYYSHLIGLRKPDKEIFELVLNDNKLIPQETLFIDDSEYNITTPQTLGIKTLLLEKGKEIKDYFDERGFISSL